MTFAAKHVTGCRLRLHGCRIALAWLALGAIPGCVGALAQYSTPVGTGAAKPKTLRATAVLEWTGALDKPNASRLMPIAVWDGEHYQPAGLYLAQPEPLAFAAGTQYVLERSGQEAGLFEVRTAAQLNGQWIGMGKYQAEAPPPPPKKLKPSKQLPVLSNGKQDKADKTDRADGGDRPTLHRKGGGSDGSSDAKPASTGPGTASGTAGSGTAGSGTATPAPSTGTSTSPPSGSNAGTTAGGASSPSSSQPTSTAPADPDHPTLHRRTDASDTDSSTSSSSSQTTSTAQSDPDRPTLHRAGDSGTSASAGSKAPDVDPDRPTLHKHGDAQASDSDPDRPTLHRSTSANGSATVTIDPDRPHLRYGIPSDGNNAVMPETLKGAPLAMQQIVAVSDAASAEPHNYHYQWSSSGDAAKMQAALASLAAKAAASPSATAGGGAKVVTFGPQAAASSRATARTRKGAAQKPGAPPALVDEHFAAYELSFSGGPTLVYTAHTADEGAQRVYVTMVAQPDFSGTPQVLFKQVSRGDRLVETPAMQLVDAVDTDGDGRAELVFELSGPTATLRSSTAGDGAEYAAGSRGAERQFAIYRVAGGKVDQAFATGPLP